MTAITKNVQCVVTHSIIGCKHNNATTQRSLLVATHIAYLGVANLPHHVMVVHCTPAARLAARLLRCDFAKCGCTVPASQPQWHVLRSTHFFIVIWFEKNLSKLS